MVNNIKCIKKGQPPGGAAPRFQWVPLTTPLDKEHTKVVYFIFPIQIFFNKFLMKTQFNYITY